MSEPLNGLQKVPPNPNVSAADRRHETEEKVSLQIDANRLDGVTENNKRDTDGENAAEEEGYSRLWP